MDHSHPVLLALIVGTLLYLVAIADGLDLTTKRMVLLLTALLTLLLFLQRGGFLP